MVPAYRNLPHSQAGAMGQIKQLYVKTETIYGCAFNNGSADAHSKRFEATLRVPERKSGCQPHHEIEDATALFAPPGLVYSDQAPVQRSGAKGEVACALSDWLYQFWSFGYGSGEVCV